MSYDSNCVGGIRDDVTGLCKFGNISTGTSQANGDIRISTNPSTGQIQINQNVGIQKWIDAALASFAIWRGASSIPTYTQAQPQMQYYQQPALTNEQLAALYGVQNQSNFSGKVQQFIEQNTGVVLLIGVGAVLFFLQPPRRR